MAVMIYLAKATLISILLYGYYHWFLKEKTFHSWNRSYLLSSVLLSLILPLVRIDVFSPESSVLHNATTTTTDKNVDISHTIQLYLPCRSALYYQTWFTL